MAIDNSNKPHWAWPHAVGVALAIAVYFVVYSFTGESDLFIVLVAVTAGFGGLAATWAYIRYFFPHWGRDSHTPPGGS